MCFSLDSELRTPGFLAFGNHASIFFWFVFFVSEATLFVESQLCGIVFPKGLFGVVSPFSAAF